MAKPTRLGLYQCKCGKFIATTWNIATGYTYKCKHCGYYEIESKGVINPGRYKNKGILTGAG